MSRWDSLQSTPQLWLNNIWHRHCEHNSTEYSSDKRRTTQHSCRGGILRLNTPVIAQIIYNNNAQTVYVLHCTSLHKLFRPSLYFVIQNWSVNNFIIWFINMVHYRMLLPFIWHTQYLYNQYYCALESSLPGTIHHGNRTKVTTCHGH
jgi:hypothetical protein